MMIPLLLLQLRTLATSESIKAYVDTTVAATNEVVEDTTPQLGGDLDLNSSDITGTGNINITGTIQSSGNITGTLATAAQPNITSVGTLTTLTVDNVIINGSTIGHTGDTDLITVASEIVTVAGEVSMTTLDIGGTNVTATAAELNYVDGVTSLIQTQLDTKATTGKAIAMALVFG
jgi:hypothetical protein